MVEGGLSADPSAPATEFSVLGRLMEGGPCPGPSNPIQSGISVRSDASLYIPPPFNVHSPPPSPLPDSSRPSPPTSAAVCSPCPTLPRPWAWTRWHADQHMGEGEIHVRNMQYMFSVPNPDNVSFVRQQALQMCFVCLPTDMFRASAWSVSVPISTTSTR